MTVDVSVLTPVLNEERHIEDAVATMRSQRFDGELEFIFADGGSSDRTRAILEELARAEPRIRVLDNPAGQTASGLNVALRAARASIVARMDAHTLYPPDYLAIGVERLRRGDGVVWASGPQVPHGVDPGSRAVALALGSRLGTGGASFRHATGEEIEASTGFTGVLDRSFLERVGGWDEGWPVNQDSELGARVAAAGGRMVVVPEMAAQYIPRSSMRALIRQYRRYGYYRAKTSRVHPESMRVTHLIPPAIVLMVAAAALGPRSAQTPARFGVAAYGTALAAATAVAARSNEPAAAVRLPGVFAAMHLAWGSGFLAGCLRWGPPFAAMRRVARAPRRRRL
jgi:succinoglycan biosynthesis protein ExoA